MWSRVNRCGSISSGAREGRVREDTWQSFFTCLVNAGTARVCPFQRVLQRIHVCLAAFMEFAAAFGRR